MENVIRDYLNEHINEPMDDVTQGLEAELRSRMGRRYTIRWRSFSSNGSGTSYSGIFSLCGTRYYISVTHPWHMCPSGKVEAELMC